jgi:hypothetical protein
MANTAIVLPNFLQQSAAGNVLITGTLGVTGATTLAALAATTGAFSGAVTAATTLGVTGATTLGATLAVTGATTLSGATTINNSLTVNPASGAPQTWQVANTTVNQMDANGVFMPTFDSFKKSYWDSDDFAFGRSYTKSATMSLSGNGVGVGLTAPAQHPGFLYYTNNATGASSAQPLSTFTISKAAGRTITWTGMFQLLTLSNGTDRYIAYVGMFDNLSNVPYNGAYFKYSDNVNSGKWVLAAANVASEVTTNSTTTADAGWHTFTIVLTEANATYTYYIDGVSVGTVVETALNGGTNYDVGQFGLSVNRTAGTGSVSAAVLDLYTIGYSGMTR